MKPGGKRLPSDQQGFAAIIITLVTMVVITLIVIGFATISRREQRQSLDQLMSSQAFYAAETGVEDAKHALRNFQVTNPGQPIPAKDSCTINNVGVTIYPTGGNMDVDAANNISYTCLKVDPTPANLQFDDVSANSLVVPISTALPITSLKITWQPKGAVGNPNADCPKLPSAANREFTPTPDWTCQYALLRTELVPTNSGGPINNLANSLFSAFMVPVRSGGTATYSYGGNVNQPNIVGGNCDKISYTTCDITITNLPLTTSLSLRLNSLYRTSNVTIEAFTGVGVPVPITGAQVAIDVTGKASDVLRRIRVRVPVTSTTTATAPTNALATNGSICKRFSANVGYFNVPGDITDPDDDITTGNRLCAAQTDDASFGP